MAVGWRYETHPPLRTLSVQSSNCRALFRRPSTRVGCSICVTVRLLVWQCGETLYCQANPDTPFPLPHFQCARLIFEGNLAGNLAGIPRDFFGSAMMLGRDYLRALCNEQFLPPSKWVKMGFRLCPEMGLKWVKNGFWRISPTFAPQSPLFTHFWTHYRILTKSYLKPTFSGNKLFSKKGPEAALTQHKSTIILV